MNITSQYSIIRYNGKQPLSLTNPPSSRSTIDGVTVVNPDYIKYYELLNTVEKIYDTQSSPKGNIPIFWTIPSGNDYIPSPDSTLSGLIPGKTYYFVSRSEADLPITLPLISGSLSEDITISGCSGVDYSCCPTFSSIGSTGLNSADIVLTSSSGNYHYMSIGLNNLIPNKSYYYNISSLSSNWPTYVNPRSGIYTPSSSSGNIETVAHFALDLDNNIGNLPYTYDLSSSLKDRYSLLNVFLSGINVDSDCKPINKMITLRCYDCLPKTDCPNVSFVNSPNLVLASDCCSANQTLSVNVTNAVPGREYYYEFLVSSGLSITSSATGIAVFGNSGAGKINTTFNMYNTPVGIIQVTVTDTYSDKKVMDFLSTSCGACQNTGGNNGGVTPIYSVSDVSVYTVNTTQNENYVFSRLNYGNNNWFIPCNDTSGGDYYLKSSDAITWNKYLTLGSAGNWSSIVYGNGKYVIFNNTTKKIKYSSDGENWSIGVLSGTTSPFIASTMVSGLGTYELFFANGKFRLIANGYGVNYSSSDGINWSSSTSINGSNIAIDAGLSWQQLSYINNILILIGTNSTSSYIYISTNDGASWSSPNVVLGLIRSKKHILYTNNIYYIATSDRIISSTNGTTWSVVYNPTEIINSFSYNGQYSIIDIAATANSKFSVSTDLVNYIVRYPADSYAIGCTYNVNNKFLSIARNGTVYGHLDGLNLYKLPTNFSSSTVWDNTQAIIANNKVVFCSTADKKIASFSIA